MTPLSGEICGGEKPVAGRFGAERAAQRRSRHRFLVYDELPVIAVGIECRGKAGRSPDRGTSRQPVRSLRRSLVAAVCMLAWIFTTGPAKECNVLLGVMFTGYVLAILAAGKYWAVR